ncbi:MAG: hypothetical protein NC452_20130 [Eubacterium sp.]|nr:hypothetical protein [Eubacterium sp.]
MSELAVIKAVKAAVKALYDKKFRKKLGSFLGGIIMLPVLIICIFLFLIGGILGLFSDKYIQDNWRIIKNNIYDVFDSLDQTANGEAKQAVYDFMPDFSVNLSKAAISEKYPSELLIYDTAEFKKAKSVMESAAESLRYATNTEQYFSVCRTYSVSYDENRFYAILNDSVFQSDVGINSAANYSSDTYSFLCEAAANKLNKYQYEFTEYETEEGKKATRQTLIVKGEYSRQIVEYNAVGEVELYLPEFLAMYQARLFDDMLDFEDGEKADEAIEQAMGGDFASAENEEELQSAVGKINSEDKSSAALSLLQIAELKSILNKSLSQNSVNITIDLISGYDYEKLVITLEAPDSEEWYQVFQLDEVENAEAITEEYKSLIVQILTDAEISEDEFYLNLDNFFQNALFVYFQGFFNLPVESSELVQNGNGIIDKYGDYSRLHTMGYNYSKMQETGVTLALENPQTEIKVELLPSVKHGCIEDIVIYDIWKGDEYSNRSIESVTYGCDFITLAYTINTVRFEKDYGFAFPTPFSEYNEEMNDSITMLVEYGCLSECYYPTISYQVGDSIKSQIENGDFSIGICNSGITNQSEQNAATNYDWCRHNENVPHLTIKTAFFNYSGIDLYNTDVNTYSGITGNNFNGWYLSNPMLWFKGFRTEVEDEALTGLMTA